MAAYFSIVTPVYNGREYLDQAYESLKKQSFQDWEWILVNDASKDDSKSWMLEKKEEDPRIKVISFEENRGAGKAREEGVKLAQGSYLCFLDVDDKIDLDLLENLYEVLLNHPAQVTVFGVTEEYLRDGKLTKTKVILPEFQGKNVGDYSVGEDGATSFEAKFIQKQEEVRKELILLEKRTLYGYLWNKCYHRAYLQSVGAVFPDHVLLEDAAYNLLVFEEVASMNLLGYAPYHYQKKQGKNLTAGFYPDYFFVHKNHVKDLLRQQERFGLANDATKTSLADILVRYICSALERNCHKEAKMSHKDRKAWVEALYKDPVFLELFPYATRNQNLSILVDGLDGHRTWLCLFVGRVAYVVKTHFAGLFEKLRS